MGAISLFIDGQSIGVDLGGTIVCIDWVTLGIMTFVGAAVVVLPIVLLIVLMSRARRVESDE